MSGFVELRIGSQGEPVGRFWDWGTRYGESYAFLLGKRDLYYGEDEAAFTRELQRRLKVPVTGRFDATTAVAARYIKAADAPAGSDVGGDRRPITIYTAPGSGAPWWMGPSFELGEHCRKVLRINHQPIGFPIGGYMGLMGGDPGLSYLDVIAAQYHELKRLLETSTDVQDALARRRSDRRAPVAVELWFSGYSQSADGMLEALVLLFGDGAPFEVLRDRINGVIVFGNPATAVTGIARKMFPTWLNQLTLHVNRRNDFYAVATDQIRPLFYEWFIRAETELPFVVYTAQIIIPAMLNLISPFLGGLGGGAFSGLMSNVTTGALSAATGVGTDLIGPVVGQMSTAKTKPNPELIELLSVRGLLTSLPDMIKLIAALPGLQAHGEYHLPASEFQGRTGIQVGCDIVNAYRR